MNVLLRKKQHAMQMSSTEGSYVHHIGNLIFLATMVSGCNYYHLN